MSITNLPHQTRRRFVQAAATAASYRRIYGANDRVQLGFIGFGLIGGQHVYDFKNQPDADLVAMCDVYQPRLDEGVAACGGRARAYRDFRRLLDDHDVQAVVIGTPDHWHALMAILACAAGKDVYVQKPLTLFVREGRWIAIAAERYKRVVQVGTQQRSGKHFQKARDILRAGHIGKIHSARMAAFRNVMPGFGSPPDGTPPPDLDYDLWLGPAPRRPYNPHRALYHFRWFWDYSGGQMTNLAAHEIDIVHWVTGVPGPLAVSSSGGRFALLDNGETPDTQDTVFEYPGFTAVWSHREASSGSRAGFGLEFFGTKGSLKIDRRGFQVIPDVQGDPEDRIPTFRGHPAGGPKQTAATSASSPPLTSALTALGSSDEQFNLHARNFLDCIKSREQPIATVEDGHCVATACHLANISLRVGRKIRWDAANERILDDPEAERMLTRPYRKPWDDVLRSLSL
jgi:predicted dehydrogenase